MLLQLFAADRVLVVNEHTAVQTPSPDPDQTEFTTFMRAYQDMVFSTAVRLVGNDAQAEDIAQETFVRAYENFSRVRPDAAGGWLKTVTTNLALNHLNRHRRRWRLFSELRSSASEESSAAEIDWEVPDTLLADLSAERRRGFIDEALRRLPEHQRVPLVLYHFEDLSYEAIAGKLGVSLAKIKTDIRRARIALMHILQRAGMTHDALQE